MTAVSVVDDYIDIDINNMVINSFYTITYKGEEYIVQLQNNGSIHIFQEISDYKDPPCKEEGNKPWFKCV